MLPFQSTATFFFFLNLFLPEDKPHRLHTRPYLITEVPQLLRLEQDYKFCYYGLWVQSYMALLLSHVNTNAPV